MKKGPVEDIVEILAIVKGFKKGEPYLLSLIKHDEKNMMLY